MRMIHYYLKITKRAYSKVLMICLYCNNWNLRMNENKTKIVVFGSGKVPDSMYMFTYNHKEIETVDILNTLE